MFEDKKRYYLLRKPFQPNCPPLQKQHIRHTALLSTSHSDIISTTTTTISLRKILIVTKLVNCNNHPSCRTSLPCPAANEASGLPLSQPQSPVKRGTGPGRSKKDKVKPLRRRRNEVRPADVWIPRLGWGHYCLTLLSVVCGGVKNIKIHENVVKNFCC